jgi:hypothetical protein
MKAGRNTACACGSGRKYKRCCGGKSMTKSGFSRIAIWGGCSHPGGSVGAGVRVIAPWFGWSAQPPQGKVWSAEHGHWLDVKPSRQTYQPVSQPAATFRSAAAG